MSEMRWRRGTTAMVCTVALLGMSACGGDGGSSAKAPTTGDEKWDAIVEAAYDEGRVNVYNAASETQNERLTEAFEEKYPGIELSITRGATELPERVSAELENGTDGADVLMYSDPNWFIDHEADLATLDLPSTEGWSKDWWAVPDKAVVATALPWSMIVWNTKTFPEGFENYEDVLDPSVKGKLGTRSEVSPSVAGYLDHLETELGTEYLEGIAAQDPKFYPSGVPLMQAVGSGEVGVANLGVPSVIDELQASGAPIDYVFAEPGFGYTHAAATFAEAKRPNAGLVFMDFFLSEEGQTAYNGDGQGGSGREGIDGALSMEGYAMLDSKKFSDPAVLAEWNQKFDQYFG
jgi:iron(III) transport system substrate-binding protein